MRAVEGDPVATGASGLADDDDARVAARPQRPVDASRAHQLGRRLGVDVIVDQTGWLRSGVELVFTRNADRSLRPMRVRIGPAASERDSLAADMVLRCARYNAALHRLRQLAAQFAQAVREQRVTLTPRSAIADAHRQLGQLDAVIARRQAIAMGRSIVDPLTLATELEFFARCEAQLAPIVTAAIGTRSAPTPPQVRHRWLGRRFRHWLGD